MAVTERVRELVVAAISGLEAELYDLEFAGSVLKVTLDRDGGVDLDVIARATRTISRSIDEHDPIPGAFTLEVTSPGLERVLRIEDHWRRAIGDMVKVKTHPHVEGDRRVEGTVQSVEGDRVTIELGDGGTRSFDLDQIERAKTVFEWGPAPKPGGPKNGGSKGGTSKSSGPDQGSGRTKETQT